MKKRFLYLLILPIALTNPVFSETSLDNLPSLDTLWDIQKPVTNQEFEKAIEAIENKTKNTKKEKKKRKKKIKKISGGGTSLHNELNPDIDIQEIEPIEQNDDGLLINSPVNLVLNGTTLEKGYYNVVAEKENGKIIMKFYQSQFFKGEIIATETQDDFGEKEINFAQLIPYNNSFVKIIYGSIDFNAYVFIPYLRD